MGASQSKSIINGTDKKILFPMVDATDDETGENSLTITAYISKNGGAFAATDGSVTAVSGRDGWYQVTLASSADETDTDGELAFEADGGSEANIYRDVYTVYTPSTAAVSITLTTAQKNEIADHVARRAMDNVFASSDGDTPEKLCLASLIMKHLGKLEIDDVAGEYVWYEDDGTTELARQSVTLGSPTTFVTATGA